MPKVDPTVSTLTIAGALAIAISILMNSAAPGVAEQMSDANAKAEQAAETTVGRSQWAASATGRIEPKDGEIRIDAEAPGKIVEVLAETNDVVKKGDLLVRLDDKELFMKHAAAESEVLVREREREEEPAEKGPQEDMRKAEDAVAAAERALFKARLNFDDAYEKFKAGNGNADDVTAVRSGIADAEAALDQARQAQRELIAEGNLPLPSRLESGLTIARSDLSLIEQAIEKTRIRAPADGTVLNVWAKAGELAEPNPQTALVLFGDLTGLRVRAEVEERDVVNVRVGQRIIVRADAFPDRDFEGVVTSVAPALGPPRIHSRGPRRPNDVEVLEVLATLDGNPPLLTGMRVDTFFKNGDEVSVAP